MDDIKRQALEWLYREQKRIKISLGHLESRSGCDCCLERQNLERKQAVVEWLIGRVLSDDRRCDLPQMREANGAQQTTPVYE